MNSDMLAGRIKVDPLSPLAVEWHMIQWANSEDKKKEDRACPNHCADAALYLWRYTYHHLSKDKEHEVKKGSIEWWQLREKEEEEKYEEQLLDDANQSWWHKYRQKKVQDTWSWRSSNGSLN
jgi:hypothetical protein